MVSRLSLKGDKPRKRKVLRNVTRARTTPEGPTPSEVETSWTSATTISDINGPILITTYKRPTGYQHHDEQPIVLFADDTGEISARKDAQIIDEASSMSFPTEGVEPSAFLAKIHRTEPYDIHQVLVAMPLSTFETNSLRQSKTGKERLFALKTPTNKYFSLGTDNGVHCKSVAISNYQRVGFERVVIADEGVWFKIHIDGKYLSVVEEENKLRYEFREGDEVNSHLFVVRVQSKNTINGQTAIRKYEESSSNETSLEASIRKAVSSLEKNGIHINPTVLRRLKNAAINGKLNEQLVLERESGKSDSRC